jgi:hypothetical protein
MITHNLPLRLLIVNIDGLRQDVFHRALKEDRIPNIAGLLGGSDHSRVCHMNPVSTAPSITFCAQTTIFTGKHPQDHGITGNQFFDRFGSSSGKARFYAFDVGDALAYDDAVLTFTGDVGLVGQTMASSVPTIYEMAGRRGQRSTVVYHMVSRGATNWIRPSLVDIARLTKGGGLIGMSAEAYDQEMLNKALQHLRSNGAPDILTVYFMGLDHTSHHDGPASQMDYLSRVVDVQISRLVEQLRAQGSLEGTLVAVVSDHGQIEVIPDDRHSLRLSFPFDREMGYLFDSLGLDVNDKPFEGPGSDAVVASNGGAAHVYLRHHAEHWSAFPLFQSDVLRVGRAFWEAHETGRHAQDLKGALSIVLVRDVERGGWQANYQALDSGGRLMPVEEYLFAHPEIQTVDAAARLRHLAGPASGDVLLFANYAEGFYFGAPTVGVHGGLHPEDSLAVASLHWLGGTEAQHAFLANAVDQTVAARLAAEDRTYPSLADLAPVLARLMNWEPI